MIIYLLGISLNFVGFVLVGPESIEYAISFIYKFFTIKCFLFPMILFFGQYLDSILRFIDFVINSISFHFIN